MPVIAIRERIHSYTSAHARGGLARGARFSSPHSPTAPTSTSSSSASRASCPRIRCRSRSPPTSRCSRPSRCIIRCSPAPASRRWLARVLPPEFERSAYVWIASLLFLGVCLLWRPLPGVAWEATGAARYLLFGVQFAGLVFTLRSASRLDIWDLAGVRQVRAARKAADTSAPNDGGRLLAPQPRRTLRRSRPRPRRRASRSPRAVPLAAASDLSGLGVAGFRRAGDDRGPAALRGDQHRVSGGGDPVRGTVAGPEFGQAYRDYQRRCAGGCVPGVW